MQQKNEKWRSNHGIILVSEKYIARVEVTEVQEGAGNYSRCKFLIALIGFMAISN